LVRHNNEKDGNRDGKRGSERGLLKQRVLPQQHEINGNRFISRKGQTQQHEINKNGKLRKWRAERGGGGVLARILGEKLILNNMKWKWGRRKRAERYSEEG
jgi:hypothetical protein